MFPLIMVRGTIRAHFPLRTNRYVRKSLTICCDHAPGMNMLFSVLIVLANSIAWIAWSLKNWHRSYAWKLVPGFGCLYLAGLLELFEFAPWWGVFDAHAVWHASTIPLTMCMYSFVFSDIDYEGRLSRRRNA